MGFRFRLCSMIWCRRSLSEEEFDEDEPAAPDDELDPVIAATEAWLELLL